MQPTIPAIKLYNTLTRSVENLEPIRPGEIGIYCCGPTVYNYQHIGNLRTYVFEDLLVRTLRYAGYKVKHVMNITDVGHLVSDADEGEDKMLVAMRRENKRSYEIADYYTGIFLAHCEQLNIISPDIVCKASEHIQEMIDLIQRIEQRHFTYLRGGNVYFDIARLEDYGKLARLDLASLQAGARIEVDQNKNSPLDFALWFTKSKFENQELQWDSPWGRGYPGWHIECSAMSMKYLGDHFDIHCGGIDHIPVHHTNEIAQSEVVASKPWVKIWMHGEFLVSNQEKMSKSKGGFLTLDTLTEKGFDPAAYRFMCLGAHYRTQLSFSWEAVEGAANSLKKLKSAAIALKSEAAVDTQLSSPRAREHLAAFEEAIFADLNMPKALAALWSVLSDKELPAASKLGLIYKMDGILGLGAEGWREEIVEVPAEIAELLAQRQAARKSKNFAEADRLRDEIVSRGYIIEDSPQGPKAKKG